MFWGRWGFRSFLLSPSNLFPLKLRFHSLYFFLLIGLDSPEMSGGPWSLIYFMNEIIDALTKHRDARIKP